MMNNYSKPLISVIVLSYNQPEYLISTIDSILSQDYDNIELIICDDHSIKFDDQSIRAHISKKKSDNISNVIIHRNGTNIGTVKNINCGINLANGKYVKIIAGDDLYYDNKVFSLQIDYLENSGEPIVTGKVQHFYNDGRLSNDVLTDKYNEKAKNLFNYSPQKIIRIINKEKFCPFVTQACCFKKEYFQEYGMFDESFILVEDTAFVHRLIVKQTKVGFIDKYVVLHRMSVGISSNAELFSTRKAQYYKDLMNIVLLQRFPNSELYGKIRPRFQYKLAKFRYDMAQAKSCWKRFLLIVSNIDALLYYFLDTPKKVFDILRRNTHKLKAQHMHKSTSRKG